MTQVSKYLLPKDVYDHIFDVFLSTFVQIRTKNSASEFLNEFLTPTEKIMLAKRLVAGLLISEGYDYKEISNLLKTSSATISTFSSFYKYGKGYKKVIDKIKTDKEITEFLRMIGEKISALGTFGGKGSGAWKVVNRKLKDKKSKLLQ